MSAPTGSNAQAKEHAVRAAARCVHDNHGIAHYNPRTIASRDTGRDSDSFEAGASLVDQAKPANAALKQGIH